MKNTLLFISLFIFLNDGFAQMDPTPFNNILVEEQNQVSTKNLEYVSYSVHSDDYEAIEKKRFEVILQVAKAHKVITAIQAPKEGQQMKDEVLEILDTYKEIFTYDFAEVVELKKNRESSYEAMEEYFEAQDKAEEKLSKASGRFQKSQVKFAQKMGFEIQDSAGDDEKEAFIDIVNAVYDYDRLVFLPYFKVSKADAIFMDAMSAEKSATTLESKRKKVEATAAEAIKTLRATKAFKGDKAYRDSALDLVKYIEELAKKNYVDMVALTKLKSKNRKQLGNEGIKKYNALIEKYKATIEEYNVKMNQLIGRFNEESDKLQQKHIPKMGVTGKSTKRL